jgi:hypothetical protein
MIWIDMGNGWQLIVYLLQHIVYIGSFMDIIWHEGTLFLFLLLLLIELQGHNA